MSNDKEQLSDRLRKIQQDLKLFVDKRIELFLIESGERFAGILGKSAGKFATLFTILIAVFFLLMSFSYLIGDVLDNTALGFAIMSSFLFVIALVVYIISPGAIEERIRQQITESLLNESKSDKNDASASDNKKDADKT